MTLDFLLGLLLSLLPERLRRRWLPEWQGSLRNSAVGSGVIQLLFCLGVLLLRYPRFVDSQMNAIDSRVFIGAAQQGGDSAVKAFGLILLAAYLLTPVSLLLLYFAFEAVVRIVAAIAAGEVVGTLPLLLADRAYLRYQHRREEKRQGPIIPDVISPPPVEGSGYDLSIASCRAKPSWDHLMTVSYNDSLYEVCDYFEAAPPRRHVYLLRRAPEHKVVRGLHHYDPEETLKG